MFSSFLYDLETLILQRCLGKDSHKKKGPSVWLHRTWFVDMYDVHATCTSETKLGI